MLQDFLVFVDLADVFGAEEDLENIQSIFTEIGNEIKEIYYPACQKRRTEVFKSYQETSSEENNYVVVEVNDDHEKV